MHMIHLNARYLVNKIHELKIIAQKTRAAVIGISETCFDDTITDAKIAISDYSVLCHDRNREGGGVFAYIRNDIAFNPRQEFQNNYTEKIWFYLLLPKSKPIVVGVCYRPPEDPDFLIHFECCISKIRSDCKVMIMGDFNVDYFKQKCSLYKNYKNILHLFDLNQLIKTVTHLTDTSSTLIDHIVCNNNSTICQSGTLTSEHFAIYCTRKVLKSQIGRSHNVIKIRSLRNYSVEVLLETLSSVNWPTAYYEWCKPVMV